MKLQSLRWDRINKDPSPKYFKEYMYSFLFEAQDSLLSSEIIYI